MIDQQELHESELVDLAIYYCKHYSQYAVEIETILGRALVDDGFDIDFGFAEMQEKYEDEMDRLCNPSDYTEEPIVDCGADYL